MIWSIKVVKMPVKKKMIPRSIKRKRKKRVFNENQMINKMIGIAFTTGINNPAAVEHVSRKAKITLVSCILDACANPVLLYPNCRKP